MASRKLSESDVYRLAECWLQADTEEKKELLIKYGVTKGTLYNSMQRYGVQFKKIIH